MLAALKARIEAIAPNPFVRIAAAAEIASLAENPPARTELPAAFVYPAGHAARAPQFGTGITTQPVAARYGVLIFVPAQAERHGDKAAQEIEPFYQALRKQLVGWMPDDAGDETFLAPMALASGRALAFADGLMIWSDEYVIEQLLRVA